MSIYEVRKDGEVLNRIMLDDHTIILSPKELEDMPLDWRRAWDFYVVEDGVELIKTHNTSRSPLEEFEVEKV